MVTLHKVTMPPTWGAERGVSRSDEGRRETEDFCADAAVPSEVRFSGGLRGDGRLAELWSSEALGTCRDSRSSIFNYYEARVLPTLHGSSGEPERGPMHSSSPGGETERHTSCTINQISREPRTPGTRKRLQPSVLEYPLRTISYNVTVSTATTSALLGVPTASIYRRID